MKKAFIWSAAGLAVLICALAVLDLFVFAVPAWVFILAAALLAALNITFFLKHGDNVRGKRYKILVAAFSALFIAAGIGDITVNPYFNSTFFRSTQPTLSYDTALTSEQALEDMAELRKIVKKVHPDFLYGTPEGFETAFSSACSSIKSRESITVNELAQTAEGVLAHLGDAHTYARCSYSEPHYLRTVAEKKAGGWSVSEINGKTIAELAAENASLFSFETESWEIEQIKSYLTSVENLAYLGIDANGVTYEFVNKEGQTVAETYTAADFVTYDEYIRLNAQYMENTDESFVSYEISEPRSLAVLTLKECRYDSEYKKCVKDMFTEVKRLGIENVAVDVRDNCGGNSLVANEFIRYLNVDTLREPCMMRRLGFFMTGYRNVILENNKCSDLLFDGNVFLLCDSGSFSSAMFFAEMIKDNELGTLIGEAPGNVPNGCGDIATFELDNSGIKMSVSTSKIVRADRETQDTLVEPDIKCSSEEALETLYKVIGGLEQ